MGACQSKQKPKDKDTKPKDANAFIQSQRLKDNLNPQITTEPFNLIKGHGNVKSKKDQETTEFKQYNPG